MCNVCVCIYMDSFLYINTITLNVKKKLQKIYTHQIYMSITHDYVDYVGSSNKLLTFLVFSGNLLIQS